MSLCRPHVLVVSVGILSAAVVTVVGQVEPSVQVGRQTREATNMLVAARTAMGGDAKVLGLKSLKLTGSEWSSQTVVGGYTQDMETPIEFRMAFPDRFVRISLMPGPTPVVEIRKGFDGERTISTIGGKSSPVASDATYVRRVAAELLLVMLARTEAWGALTIEADGANAVRVRGPAEYAARVEFDPVSHLPVRLLYRQRRQVRTPNTITGRGSSVAPSSRGGGAGAGAAAAADLPEVEIIVTVRDRRDTAGVLLPRRLMWTAQGIDLWELRFDEVLVNPPLTAADFGG